MLPLLYQAFRSLLISEKPGQGNARTGCPPRRTLPSPPLFVRCSYGGRIHHGVVAAPPFGFYGLIQPAQSIGDPPLFLHPSLASASLELATPSIHDPSVYLQLPGLLCCAVLLYVVLFGLWFLCF